jgi:hypothetical protein
MDSHHLLLAGLPAHPIPAVRAAPASIAAFSPSRGLPLQKPGQRRDPGLETMGIWRMSVIVLAHELPGNHTLSRVHPDRFVRGQQRQGGCSQGRAVRGDMVFSVPRP